MQKQLYKGMNNKQEHSVMAYSREQAEFLLNLRLKKKFGYSNIRDVKKMEKDSPSNNKNIS
jgi:hypothetical protein